MEQPDPYKNWLEDFNREVDAAQSAVPGTAESGPSVDKTLSEFEAWWKKGGDLEAEPDPMFDSEEISKELELSRKEIRLLKSELRALKNAAPQTAALQKQLGKLGEERGRLSKRIEELEQDNGSLRDREGEVRRQAGELRVAMTQAKEAYESQVRQLEQKSRNLAEQMRLMGEDRQFLRNEFTRQAARLEAFESELKAAYGLKAQLEKEKLSLQKRIDDLEGSLSAGGERNAALDSALSELRRQSAELAERFVRSQNTAAAELAESRKGIEDLAQLEQRTGKAAAARQNEAEERIRETTRYLETKLTEIQDENRGRLEEFRDMIDTLSRLAGRDG